MADPTYSQMKTLLTEMTKLYAVLKGIDSGFVAADDTVQDLLKGDYAPGSSPQLVANREALSLILEEGSLASVFIPVLRQLGASISTTDPGGSLDQIWEETYDKFISTPDTVKEIGLTFAAFVLAAGGVGSGQVIRFGVDENALEMEGWFADTYTLQCTDDSRSLGQEQSELFELRGTDRGIDSLEELGSGLVVQGLISLNASDSLPLLLNPSFESQTSGATEGTELIPTAVPSWTFDGGFTNTLITVNAADIFRKQPGQTTAAAVVFGANKTIRQNAILGQINWDFPYLCSLRVKKRSAATGSLKLRIKRVGSGGAEEVLATQNITAQVNGTYALLQIATGDSWARDWAGNALELEIEYTGFTVGSVVIDDIVWAPATRVGGDGDGRVGRGSMGHYLAVLGGATDWVEGDELAATDTEAGSPGLLQRLFRRQKRGYLPHTSGVATVPDS